jgi:hypothetical protein
VASGLLALWHASSTFATWAQHVDLESTEYHLRTVADRRSASPVRPVAEK